MTERRGVGETGDDRTILKKDVKPRPDTGSAKESLAGSTNGNPNATPGAQTSGANSPRK